MPTVWAIVLVFVNAVALASNVFGLPGNWLMLIFTDLVAWARA